MARSLVGLVLMSAVASPVFAATDACDVSRGVTLQVLGSGGPELTDGRASSGYLIWHNGKARVLVDAGPGVAYNFERAGANYSDLAAILVSHFHVDHSASIPALIKGGYFSDRSAPLVLAGPSGNEFLPSADAFVTALFASSGAYPYLGDVLSADEGAYELQPTTLDVATVTPQVVHIAPDVTSTAITVHHGPLPALGWRVDIGGRSLVFSGDNSNKHQRLAMIANDADLLLVHNAIPQGATGVARALHMPPSEIAALAAQVKPKSLVLSHRMTRSLAASADTLKRIKQQFSGRVTLANDLDCFKVEG